MNIIVSNANFLDLQKASGIRVLRHTVERQKSIKETESLVLKQFQQNHISPTHHSSMSSNNTVNKHLGNSLNTYESELFLEAHNKKKKPPARLKPLVNHNRERSVIKFVTDFDADIPAIAMKGASLVQNLAFSTDCDSFEDKLV